MRLINVNQKEKTMTHKLIIWDGIYATCGGTKIGYFRCWSLGKWEANFVYQQTYHKTVSIAKKAVEEAFEKFYNEITEEDEK